MNYTLKEFLRLLHNKEPICFIKNKKIIKFSKINEYNGVEELHYIPNIGGTKDADITQFNAYFIDLDCGRDEHDNYFDLDVVSRYKDQKLKELRRFQPSPSAIVQTRNGFQVLWFIKDAPTPSQWRRIENYLVEKFDADVNVKNPAKQLRLPCTVWMKEGYPPFYCDILKLEHLYYTVFDFQHHFEEDAISRTDAKIFTNYKDVFHHLTKEVDLFEYLKEFYNLKSDNPNSFCCICHIDKHPSASVFKADGGTWLYSCRSSSCPFKIGNIIQVVQEKNQLSRHKAIEKICSDLGIIYKENEEYRNLLMDNIHVINDDIKHSHQDLYSVSYRYLHTLRYLHYAALDTLQYADANGFLFSISTGHLAEQLYRSDRKTTTEDISYFAMLDLIRKIDISNPNISPEYRKMIKAFQGDKLRHINVYSLPIYDLQQLRHSDDIAKIVKEKNIRKTDFTYDTVYNAFGKEVADNVFPQVKGKRTHDPDEFLISNIEHLLDAKGYFTLKTLKERYKENHWRFSETIFVHQLPLIMDRLNLKRLQTNNEIKKQYGIDGKGFPTLYVRKGN